MGRSLTRVHAEMLESAEAVKEAASAAAMSVASLRRRDARRLRDAGLLLVALPLPEPFTNAAGLGLLLAARAISRAGLEDLVEEYRRIASALRAAPTLRWVRGGDPAAAEALTWRRGWDSNPRGLSPTGSRSRASPTPGLPLDHSGTPARALHRGLEIKV